MGCIWDVVSNFVEAGWYQSLPLNSRALAVLHPSSFRFFHCCNPREDRHGSCLVGQMIISRTQTLCGMR